jgi:hypothetical protein
MPEPPFSAPDSITTGNIFGVGCYNNTLIIGASIVLRDIAGNVVDRTTTKLGGKYIFEEISAGTGYSIVTYQPGSLERVLYNVTVVGGETTEVFLSIPEPELSWNEYMGIYPIRVLIDDALLICSDPIMESNRVLVPFRAFFEGLGAQVGWYAETQTVTAKRDGLELSLQIGSPEMIVNGETVSFDVLPRIVENHTFVPIRALSEALDLAVDWDAVRRQVIITTE